MLVIDVSQSMRATDVSPSRLAARRGALAVSLAALAALVINRRLPA
jgi:hypothetical protein